MPLPKWRGGGWPLLSWRGQALPTLRGHPLQRASLTLRDRAGKLLAWPGLRDQLLQRTSLTLRDQVLRRMPDSPLWGLAERRAPEECETTRTLPWLCEPGRAMRR